MWRCHPAFHEENRKTDNFGNLHRDAAGQRALQNNRSGVSKCAAIVELLDFLEITLHIFCSDEKIAQIELHAQLARRAKLAQWAQPAPLAQLEQLG